MLTIDFGVLAVSWWLIERVFHRQYFWSNVVGDSIGLPLIAGMTTLMLQHLPNHRITEWYSSAGWYAAVFVAGIMIATLVAVMEVLTGNFNRAQEASPSKAWHAIMWPVFFWILVAPAPAVIASGKPTNAFIWALVGAAIWAITLIKDFTTHPTPLGGVVEFSWQRFFRGEHPSKIRAGQWRVAHRQLPKWFFRHYDSMGRPLRK